MEVRAFLNKDKTPVPVPVSARGKTPTTGTTKRKSVIKTSKGKKTSKTQEKGKLVERVNVQDDLDEILRNQQQSANEEVEAMLKAMDPHYASKEKALKEIAFIFDPRHYDGEVHYTRDGNGAFYTQENEKKRAALKTNPMVEEAINSVMNVYTFERDGTLTKAEYIKVHTCIARILRQDLKESSLLRLIEEDWKHDAKGRDYMNKKEVFDSLFELGDIWSPDIDAYQYVVFFEKLGKVLKGQEELKHLPKTRICAVPK